MLGHPNLGTVHGNHVDGVTQFRGVKYASMKDRLAPPELMEKYSQPLDATKLG